MATIATKNNAVLAKNSLMYGQNLTLKPSLVATYGSHHRFVQILLIKADRSTPFIPKSKCAIRRKDKPRLIAASTNDFHFICQNRPYVFMTICAGTLI